MKTFTISVPSKTYLVGEYVVMNNGSALLVNTQPRFELTVTPQQHTDNTKENPWLTKGTIAALYNNIKNYFANYKLTFKDPHAGRGGFGASAAQYVLLLAAKEILTTGSVTLLNTLPQMIDNYRDLSATSNGVRPSGGDLISQLVGKISLVHLAENRIESLDWPFSKLNFFLIATGNKVNTHEHLRNLTVDNYHPLQKAAIDTIAAFQQQDQTSFIRGVNLYAQILGKLSLCHPFTQSLLNELNKLPFVLAAKGCGALGADVILVLCEKNHSPMLRAWTAAQALPIIAEVEDISEGLSCSGRIS